MQGEWLLAPSDSLTYSTKVPLSSSFCPSPKELGEGLEVLRACLLQQLEGHRFRAGDDRPCHLQLLDGHLPVLFAAGADRIHGNVDRKTSLKEIEGGLEDADMGFHAREDDRLPAQLREAHPEGLCPPAREDELGEGLHFPQQLPQGRDRGPQGFSWGRIFMGSGLTY